MAEVKIIQHAAAAASAATLGVSNPGARPIYVDWVFQSVLPLY